MSVSSESRLGFGFTCNFDPHLVVTSLCLWPLPITKSQQLFNYYVKWKPYLHCSIMIRIQQMHIRSFANTLSLMLFFTRFIFKILYSSIDSGTCRWTLIDDQIYTWPAMNDLRSSTFLQFTWRIIELELIAGTSYDWLWTLTLHSSCRGSSFL